MRAKFAWEILGQARVLFLAVREPATPAPANKGIRYIATPAHFNMLTSFGIDLARTPEFISKIRSLSSEMDLMSRAIVVEFCGTDMLHESTLGLEGTLLSQPGKIATW